MWQTFFSLYLWVDPVGATPDSTVPLGLWPFAAFAEQAKHHVLWSNKRRRWVSHWRSAGDVQLGLSLSRSTLLTLVISTPWRNALYKVFNYLLTYLSAYVTDENRKLKELIKSMQQNEQKHEKVEAMWIRILCVALFCSIYKHYFYAALSEGGIKYCTPSVRLSVPCLCFTSNQKALGTSNLVETWPGHE